MRQTNSHTKTSSKLGAVLAVLFAVSLLVPQLQYYGHGARLTFGLFFLWCCVAGIAGRLWEVLFKQKLYISMTLAFLASLLVIYRWRSEDTASTYQTIIGHLQIIMCLVVASYYGSYEPRLWLRMREWMIILIGLAIVPSLGTLYNNPEVARYLMSEGTEEGIWYQNAVEKLGVGTYGLYTPLAIIIPCWVISAELSAGIRQLFLFAAIAITAFAIGLSSFTAATMLMLTGFGAMLVGLPLMRRGHLRWFHLALSAAIFSALLYVGNFLIQKGTSTVYVAEKTVRLYNGIMESGIITGEETGRGDMFVRTFKTFISNPIIGVGYQIEGYLVGGHSSWVDPWAQHGIVGYLPFFLFQGLLTYNVIKKWARKKTNIATFGSMVCWCLYWFAGSLNPVINFVLPSVLLFTDWLEGDITTLYTPVTYNLKAQSVARVNA